MAEVFIKLNILGEVVHGAVDANTDVAGLSGTRKYFFVHTLLASNNRGQELDAGAFGHREDLIDDLIDGLTFDLTAAFRTMRDADTGIKKSEVIVDFRHSADRRTRIPVRRFLVD